MDDDDQEELRSRWRRRSLAAGWSLPADWWTPAVEHTITALHAGRGVLPACEALGAARARAGVGIGEGLSDLAALYASLGLSEPPFTAARAYAVGWTEASFAPITALCCEDPLTGLASPAYLRTRLAELYRGSRAERHRLVVAEPYEWPAGLTGRLAELLTLARALRRAFPDGETLAQLAPARVGALARAGPALPGRVAGLHPYRVSVEALPGGYEQALTLIRTLSLGA
ncbi:hypothetical protein [Nonomuraea longicatena]|uniref:Uncharacterized protein n=1 Tax=Nonomuraea longicatena TaxID=83682 RepID=A0ABP4AEV7_9ACTN